MTEYRCMICNYIFLGHGRSKYCNNKKCQKEKKLLHLKQTMEWGKRNPERVKENNKKCAKEHYKNNKEEIKKYQREHYKNNKEEIKKYLRQNRILYYMYGTAKVSLEVKQMTALQQNLRKNFTQETIKQIEKGNTHEAYI